MGFWSLPLLIFLGKWPYVDCSYFWWIVLLLSDVHCPAGLSAIKIWSGGMGLGGTALKIYSYWSNTNMWNWNPNRKMWNTNRNMWYTGCPRKKSPLKFIYYFLWTFLTPQFPPASWLASIRWGKGVIFCLYFFKTFFNQCGFWSNYKWILKETFFWDTL